MRGGFATFTILLLVATSLAQAAPPPAASDGLSRACDQADSDKPCEHLHVIPDTTVGAGDSRTYENGTWIVEGTIVVEAGGSVHIADATFLFGEESGGILVEQGGELRVRRSSMEPDGSSSPYVLDLAPLALFTLNDSTVRGGNGVKLRTSEADVSGNLLQGIPLALLAEGVTLTIHHNEFRDNDVAVNLTGGQPTLDANLFVNGTTCVRDWLSDPTITNNTFRGCHTGIWHERSESYIALNDMEDDALEPGSAIYVVDTESPVLEGNIITNFYYGIVVQNATAYIRNNTIFGNANDGVRVLQNTGPMDIQGNDIYDNGGDGIQLANAEDVVVRGNRVANNSGHGIVAEGATGLVVEANNVSQSGADGIRLLGALGANVTGSTLRDNAGSGIVVGEGSFGSELSHNDVALQGAHGIVVRANGTSVRSTAVGGSGLSGVLVESAIRVSLQEVEAHTSGGDGFRFVRASVNASALWAHGNGGSGLAANGTGNLVLVDANASQNDGHGFLLEEGVDVLLSRGHAIGNVGHGLRNLATGDVSADEGWWEDNGGAGVSNAATATLSSICSYWGSADGPSTPSAPTDGDEVEGAVDYEPYRSSPDAACSPTMLD